MQSKGFTIVELLVSATIVLIVSGWAFLSFQKFSEFWDARAVSSSLRSLFSKNESMLRSGKIASYRTWFVPGSAIMASERDWLGLDVTVPMSYVGWQVRVDKPTSTGTYSIEAYRRGTYTGSYYLANPTSWLFAGHDGGPYRLVAQEISGSTPVNLNVFEFGSYSAFAFPDGNWSNVTLASVSDGVRDCDSGRLENAFSTRKVFCVDGWVDYLTWGLFLRFDSDTGPSVTVPILQ